MRQASEIIIYLIKEIGLFISPLVTRLATTQLGIWIRKLLRGSGLNVALKQIVYSRDYESEFENALIALVDPGDIIWDVGANQGLYTAIFTQNLRGTGKVIAFEPNPDAFRLLIDRFRDNPLCELFELALGKEEGSADLIVSHDLAMDPTASIYRAKTSGDSVTVNVTTGASLIVNERCPPPTLLKIDVEGFELDVLDGLQSVFRASPPRVIAVEIHVGILQERGVVNPVDSIINKLSEFGYEFEFPDASHLIAKRV